MDVKQSESDPVVLPPRVSTKDAGRDPLTGELVPHERSQKIAGQVEAMAAMGLTSDEIAVALDLRPGQVREYYARELEAAPIKANVQVAQAFFNIAKSGTNWKASHAWLKSRAGWRDKDADNVLKDVIAIHIHI